MLVVDDEPLILISATEMIEQAGWTALEASNAADALKVLADHPEVDLLFTDVNMPGKMDGLELAARVHEQYPHIRLVVTSGKRYLTDHALPGSGIFLAKPYGYEQLIDVLASKLA